MAVFRFQRNSEVSMSRISSPLTGFFEASVTDASDSRIAISAVSEWGGTRRTVFTGSGFDVEQQANHITDINSGIINSIQEWEGSTLSFSMTGLKIAAADFFDATLITSDIQHKDILLGGHDAVYGTEATRNEMGQEAGDWLEGWTGNDTIFGFNGNDSLLGQVGNDVLQGGNGQDNLSGGTGADRLIGGMGADNLSGGSDRARDVFVFNAVNETHGDSLFQFVSGVDDVDLSGIDANTKASGNQSFSFSGSRPGANAIWVTQLPEGYEISGDTNGDKQIDFMLYFSGTQNLVREDFIL